MMRGWDDFNKEVIRDNKLCNYSMKFFAIKIIDKIIAYTEA